MKIKNAYKTPEIVVIPTSADDIIVTSGFEGEDHLFGTFFNEE